MTKDDKWGMFRQFMYNELGISKEIIREWIREAVQEQVTLLINKAYNNFDIESYLKKEIINKYNKNDCLVDKVKSEVAKDIIQRVKFDIKIKEC